MGTSVFQAMPFVRFLLAYLLGIGLGYHIAPSASGHRLVFIALISLIVFYFAFVLISRLRYYTQYRYISTTYYLFLLLLGWYLTWQPHPAVNNAHFSNADAERLIGYIADEPVIKGNFIRFPVHVIHTVEGDSLTKSTGNLLVRVRIDSAGSDSQSCNFGYRYGDVYLLPAKQAVVDPPFNPNEFDYKKYLADQRIWHRVYVYAEEFVKLAGTHGNPLIREALESRKKIVDKFDHSFQSKEVTAIASALILGYRNQLDSEVIKTFSVTGTIHVLAVSGLHVGIIYLVFSTLLFWMKGRRLKLFRAVLLVLLIWLYALLSGLSPSVLRASIMISFGVISVSFSRRSNTYNTIAASAFFLLIYNPLFIAGIGFKLSYLAVLGIVMLYPKINTLFVFKNKIAAFIWSSAAVSIAAQLATFPLVLFYFHTFPLYFIPANLVIILPIGVLMYIGLLVILLPYGLIHTAFAWVFENAILALTSVLQYFESLPSASLHIGWINQWGYLAIYSLIGAVFYYLIFRKRKALYLFFISMMVLSSFRTVHKVSDQQTRIKIYNVQQNMAIGVFNQESTVVVTDSLNIESNRLQYSVVPDLNAARRLSQLELIRKDTRYRADNILLNSNILQVKNWSAYIYSQAINPSETIEVDLLYIRNNPPIDLEQLQEHIKFQEVLLDGSNTDRFIRRVTEQAFKINIPVYVLKNNFAYVWSVD